MINKIKKSLLLGVLTTSIISPASSLVNFEIDRDLQKMSDPTISLTEKVKHLNNSQLAQALNVDSSLRAKTNNALADSLNQLNAAVVALAHNQEQLQQKISGYSDILNDLVNDLYALKNIPIIENILQKHQGALAKVNSGSFESPFSLRNLEDRGKEKMRAPGSMDSEKNKNSDGILGRNLGENNNDQFDLLINKIPAPAPPPPPLAGKIPPAPHPPAGKIPAPPPPPVAEVNKNNPAAVKAAPNKKPLSMMDELKDKSKRLSAFKNIDAKKEQESIAKKVVLLMRNGITLQSPLNDIKEALEKIMPNDLNTVTADESGEISGDLNTLNRWRKIILNDQEKANNLGNKLKNRPENKHGQNIDEQADNNEKSRNNLMFSLNAENPQARLRPAKDNPQPVRPAPGDDPEKQKIGGFRGASPTTLFTIQNSLDENKIKIAELTAKRHSLPAIKDNAAEREALSKTIGYLNDTIKFQENKLKTETKQRLSVLLEMGLNKDNVSDEQIKSITTQQLKNAQIDNITDDMATEWKDKIIQAFKPE